MTTVEAAIVNRLRTAPGVLALVPAERITADQRPQESPLPAVVYSVTAGVGIPTDAGPTDLNRRTFSVESWAKTRVEAIDIGNAIIGALDGYQDGGVGLSGVFFDDQADFLEPAQDGGGTGTALRTVDFLVWATK